MRGRAPGPPETHTSLHTAGSRLRRAALSPRARELSRWSQPLRGRPPWSHGQAPGARGSEQDSPLKKVLDATQRLGFPWRAETSFILGPGLATGDPAGVSQQGRLWGRPVAMNQARLVSSLLPGAVPRPAPRAHRRTSIPNDYTWYRCHNFGEQQGTSACVTGRQADTSRSSERYGSHLSVLRDAAGTAFPPCRSVSTATPGSGALARFSA